MSPTFRDNRDYYDDFSEVYEDQRFKGYHRLIDDLEFEILEPYISGRRVLEAGCGTGLILQRTAGVAASASGIDLSPGMLKKTRERGLDCCLGDLTALPYEDSSFDTVYSFKVLAHVKDIRKAISEMARVTTSGGHLILEFYNPLSLRGLIKHLKNPTRIGDRTNDEEVFTRYDRLQDIRGYLPEDLELLDTRGVRIITPFAAILKLPLIGRLFSLGEHALLASSLRGLAGFLVVILRKR